jgi:hypothetical protein
MARRSLPWPASADTSICSHLGRLSLPAGAAGLSPAFQRRGHRISCQLSVVSCQGNLRFANGTEITVKAVGGGNLAATDTVAGNTSGRRQQAEWVEDWSHQLTLLLPICWKKGTSSSREGRVVVMGRFPGVKRPYLFSDPFYGPKGQGKPHKR